MALPQEIKPLNSEIQDALVKATDGQWIEYEPGASLKILYLGNESGQWAVLFRWKKGFVAGQHKHLSGSHTFVLKGKLQVRDGILNAGDYVYEPNGMLHGETKALEDTEYLFICLGPLLIFSDEAFTGYFGWEELARMRDNGIAAT
ncbi:MAG TPA: cupin domain-containing protein [Povalibacter sp.]|uniref:cupin domain-containing protein n=1 Tax=Povalibacter sp. TaxID=1962978 RepID=UPI002C7B1634|nr:cupin domain-containing protein [Povalibacter sp.]HMN47168.1 cupin domain-containing protein [Povalibacter sp.]